MIKVDNKEWKKMDDASKIAYCDALLEEAVQSREKRDLEWYLNYRFIEGDHYLSYNTTTKELVPTPRRSRGEVRIVVNKVKSSVRAIQNYATSIQPKWEIIPGDTDEDTVKTARKLGKVLDYLYRRLKLETIISGVIESGLHTSVGWVELDWDKDAEGGMGQVRIRLHDPFDIWVAKDAKMYRGRVESSFMAKTIVKSLDQIANDERYNEKTRKTVQADDAMATSKMKAKILRKEMGSKDRTMKTATVKEFMLWDEGGNDSKGKIQLFTYAGDKVLRDEETKMVEYPLYCYQISMNPLRIYQRAWTSDAIPLNKALNRSLSQKIMYVNKALQPRLIAEKGHGANSITNEAGEIIEINKGREFKFFEAPPLPAGFDRLNTELVQYIEDLLGAHDAALGRLPSGARSGKVLEALQSADANNLSNITLSMESFLSVLGERVLEIVSERYVASRVAKIADPEDGQEFIKVVGEGAKNAPKDALKITADNEVIVKIGSWLGHTLEAKRDTILQLAELGVLPAEEVLRQFEFPNISELSEKAREQRLEQHQMDLAVAGRGGEQGQAQPGQQPEEDPMIDLADQENTEIMNGTPVPPTEGATPEHTQAHIDFANSQTFQQNATPDIMSIMQAHIQGEMQ